MNALYNPFIRDTAATFERDTMNRAEREAWLRERSANPRWPVFVAEEGEALLGFAGASAFDPRGAYETSVKVSVFICPEAAGRGVGKALYAALFDYLATQDVHRAYALIVAPNPASVRLHEAFGFTYISTLNEVGRKFGRFHDVMWYEKRF